MEEIWQFIEEIWQFIKDNAAAVGAAAAAVAVLIGVATGLFRAVFMAGVGLIKLFKRKKEKTSKRSVEVGPAIEPVPEPEPERIVVQDDRVQPRDGADNPTVFISYSQDDKNWKDRVATQLQVLRHQNILILDHDRRNGVGDALKKDIESAIDVADIAVLLVSANFLTTDSIISEEIPRILQRRRKEDLQIIPIIIKMCDWEAVDWLHTLQVHPRDRHAISEGNEYEVDADLAAVAKEIRVLLKHAVQLRHAVQRAEPIIWPVIDPENISLGRLPITVNLLLGRELELDLLDGAWSDSDTNVISLVGWGGAGKSALVLHWLRKLAKENYRGAKRVYGVSFYSQGTREMAASADTAVDEALRWFGDPDPAAGSPWDKGERLAKLVRSTPALLILDGLEPLQNPPGRDAGRLKDPALQSLVRELAATNPGLCVITTRHRVADIDHLSATTAPVIELENLTDEAGAALLSDLGVRGSEEELQRASYEVDGHALSIHLLGTYLRDVFDGAISGRKEISSLGLDVEQGGHAKRVMESYENWFGQGPELAALRITSLFDRPANSQAVAAVREPPAISGLTDALEDLTDAKWRQTLAKLRRAGLLAQEDPEDPDTLDAHPLVREHFGQQLREQHPEAWRAGNDRLYEHYKAAAPELPDTLEQMAPLFAAVAHGCASGRHQEVFEGVYIRQIQREQEAYITHRLGAIGADLAVLSGFFASPWRHPVAGLTQRDKAFVLDIAGFDLRALGRLAEAVEPIQAGLTSRIAQEDWHNAAIAALNVSQLCLAIGDLPEALSHAHQSVELADQSGDVFLRTGNRASLADVMHQAGRFAEAEVIFNETEVMQKERQPEFPLLYSLRGFQYCDLLLDQGKIIEVQERASQALQWAEQDGLSLLSLALDHLSLGRAHLTEAQEAARGDFSKAAQHLDQAADGLRQAGVQEFLARGLLARAALH